MVPAPALLPSSADPALRAASMDCDGCPGAASGAEGAGCRADDVRWAMRPAGAVRGLRIFVALVCRRDTNSYCYARMVHVPYDSSFFCAAIPSKSTRLGGRAGRRGLSRYPRMRQGLTAAPRSLPIQVDEPHGIYMYTQGVCHQHMHRHKPWHCCTVGVLRCAALRRSDQIRLELYMVLISLVHKRPRAMINTHKAIAAMQRCQPASSQGRRGVPPAAAAAPRRGGRQQ